jgi:hypothetical protein
VIDTIAGCWSRSRLPAAAIEASTALRTGRVTHEQTGEHRRYLECDVIRIHFENVQALALFRQLGEGPWIVRPLATVAFAAAHRGEIERARMAIERLVRTPTP